MATTYSRAVKAFTTKRDQIDYVDAIHVNDLQGEVSALEETVGVYPLSMVDKDPNQPALWKTIATRLDALDYALTTPVFASWIGGPDDVVAPPVIGTETYWTDEEYSQSYNYSVITWGPWTDMGLADSPDNFPGGMWGQTPTHAPAYEVGTGGFYGNKWPYGFEWKTQAEWINYETQRTLNAGGEISGRSQRFPSTVTYSGTSTGTRPVEKTRTYTIPSHYDTDERGVFLLPAPPTGHDPLSWYNGTNGFVVKKTGWYQLSGSVTWQSVVNGGADSTRRLSICGNGVPLVSRDARGSVGSMSGHKKVEYIGRLSAGTVLTLAVSTFQVGLPPVFTGALSPRLSGIYLRGV